MASTRSTAPLIIILTSLLGTSLFWVIAYRPPQRKVATTPADIDFSDPDKQFAREAIEDKVGSNPYKIRSIGQLETGMFRLERDGTAWINTARIPIRIEVKEAGTWVQFRSHVFFNNDDRNFGGVHFVDNREWTYMNRPLPVTRRRLGS